MNLQEIMMISIMTKKKKLKAFLPEFSKIPVNIKNFNL